MIENNNNESLTELAKKYPTDKCGSHAYTSHYHAFFKHLRETPIRLLEIGVGGDGPNVGGGSLRMWKEYFPYGQIVSIDIIDKSALEEERIQIYQGDQTDGAFLGEVNRKSGPFDIIIDDGSHINAHIIKSFEALFPKLKHDGIYVVEDLQTSYWKQYGGDSFDLKKKNTAMNFFKQLVDSLNHEEIDNPFFKPNYFDKNIIGMSFFHNMVFIQKGENNEGSSFLINNQKPTKNPSGAKIKYALRKIKASLLNYS